MSQRELDSSRSDQPFALISSQKLLALYAKMQACRAAAQASNKPGSAPRPAKFAGGEAALAGAAIDLRAQDCVATTAVPQQLLRSINRKVKLVSAISLAASNPATPAPSSAVTVLFATRRQSAQNPWTRALGRAAAANLPVLFVVLSAQQQAPLAEVFRNFAVPRSGYQLPIITVDGSDVVAIYRVACEAIAHARKGHGPTLIDCMIDQKHDALETMHAYLRAKAIAPPARKARTL